MSGVPGIRLRGLDLAIDAAEKLEKWLAAERLGLADTLGSEAPPVKRIAGKLSYTRVIISQLREDRTVTLPTPTDLDASRKCKSCGGRGMLAEPNSPNKCLRCHGTGYACPACDPA